MISRTDQAIEAKSVSESNEPPLAYRQGRFCISHQPSASPAGALASGVVWPHYRGGALPVGISPANKPESRPVACSAKAAPVDYIRGTLAQDIHPPRPPKSASHGGAWARGRLLAAVRQLQHDGARTAFDDIMRFAESLPHPNLTRLTRWRGSGRQGIPEIFIILVVWAGFAGPYHQKRMILGGLAALQTSQRGRPRNS